MLIFETDTVPKLNTVEQEGKGRAANKGISQTESLPQQEKRKKTKEQLLPSSQ